MTEIEHWIAGKSVSASVADLPVFNPANGEQQAKAACADASTVDSAAIAARQAFGKWATTSPKRRADILFKFRELMLTNRGELARIITAEHGKTLSDAEGEIMRGIDVIDFCTGIAHLLKGQYSQSVTQGINTYDIRAPLGVVAGITPFNFPAMVPLWMSAPAIACGNTFVLKPSEKDPSASLLVARLFKEAGLPDGVFNVVHGDKRTVDALLVHPDIAAISFVGSTPVARSIYRVGCDAGKRVQALGGAKNHMIIMPDADIKQAAGALMGAAFGSAGERCMAISVAVPVGEDTAVALTEELVPHIKALRIGPGDSQDVDMGPLITAEHRDKVASYIDAGEAEGAKVLVDGRKFDSNSSGFFLGGTLLDQVTNKMSVYTDEIFGPVLPIVRASNAADALELVNSHEYGNGAAIFTRDGMAAKRFAEQVLAGMVGINVPIPVPVATHSFGGWKGSLFGSAAIYGPEGVRFYTRLKTITERWPGSENIDPQFTFPVLHK